MDRSVCEEVGGCSADFRNLPDFPGACCSGYSRKLPNRGRSSSNEALHDLHGQFHIVNLVWHMTSFSSNIRRANIYLSFAQTLMLSHRERLIEHQSSICPRNGSREVAR